MSTDRYVVIGNPISHSKSPAIHARFAAQTGQALRYDTLLAPLGEFEATLSSFVHEGGKGCNVTVPFKEDAWRLATERSGRAELAGALNTLQVRADGSVYGDNTDGVGLVRDLIENHQVELAGRRILLLGAGGAARGVISPLLEAQPSNLVIANRTAERAQNLADIFSFLGVDLVGCGLSDVRSMQFDIIINATAAGLQGTVPPIPLAALRPGGCCYDMVYADVATPFQKWARAAGADQALDGLGMLVEQAAESFYLWRGVRPETGDVISTLRNGT